MEEIDCSATAHEASVLRLSTLTSTSNDSVKAAEIYYDIEHECSHCNFSTYSIEIIQLHEKNHLADDECSTEESSDLYSGSEDSGDLWLPEKSSNYKDPGSASHSRPRKSVPRLRINQSKRGEPAKGVIVDDDKLKVNLVLDFPDQPVDLKGLEESLTQRNKVLRKLKDLQLKMDKIIAKQEKISVSEEQLVQAKEKNEIYENFKKLCINNIERELAMYEPEQTSNTEPLTEMGVLISNLTTNSKLK
uniref:Uncharacterized protein n=1 Tax=Daphnia galeata TaxID=27404 RepID=A0A8J2RD57_9CRUS|nr:unnamed protein product [Daphnia galeata]